MIIMFSSWMANDIESTDLRPRRFALSRTIQPIKCADISYLTDSLMDVFDGLTCVWMFRFYVFVCYFTLKVYHLLCNRL